MARRFHPLPDSATAVRCRFAPALYPGALTSARGRGRILRPRRFAVALPVFPRSATAKEIRPALVAPTFAARCLPGTGRPSAALVDPFRCQIGLVIAAAAGFVVSGFVRLSRIADSACPVCPSAAVMGKGRVVALVAFCFLVPRSSSLRNRSFLLPLCFAAPP